MIAPTVLSLAALLFLVCNALCAAHACRNCGDLTRLLVDCGELEGACATNVRLLDKLGKRTMNHGWARSVRLRCANIVVKVWCTREEWLQSKETSNRSPKATSKQQTDVARLPVAVGKVFTTTTQHASQTARHMGARTARLTRIRCEFTLPGRQPGEGGSVTVMVLGDHISCMTFLTNTSFVRGLCL
jgi:hypothetical protein